MSRKQSADISKQSNTQAADAYTHSQEDRMNAYGDLNAYKARLSDYMDFGNKTYGEGGSMAKDIADEAGALNTEATDVASAGSRGLESDLALNSLRTGENTAGYGTTAAEARRQGQRDLTDELAKNSQYTTNLDLQRLAALSKVNQTALDASKFPVQFQEQLSESEGGQSNQARGVAEQASAASPGFWDTFSQDLIGAGGVVAAGFCPCEGSLIRMANGKDKPVEQLKKGDWVFSIGTLSGPNQVLEDVYPKLELCYRITTKDGKVHAGSFSHAVALATGGYAYLPECLNKTVIGDLKTDLVIKVESVGKQTVYPLLIGGSHCYLADGIMCLQ